MKKAVSRIISFTIVAMTVAAVLSLTAGAVFGGTAEQSFNFSFSQMNAGATTSVGIKYDDSCSYMHFDGGTVPYFIAWVSGVDGEIREKRYFDEVFDEVYQYRINRGESRFMYSCAYDKHYTKVVIDVQAGAIGTAIGEWSPDSIDSSDVLPPTDYFWHEIYE